MSFLLDTDVVSELRKRSPDPGVTAWFETVRPSELFLSSLTIGEIRLGIERLRRRDEIQARAIERWLTGLRTLYRDRIVSVDAGIAEAWGRISAAGVLPVVDGLLAATALAADWTIVTRNAADFQPSGVRVLNPWR
ncbi:MAG TPA: type II toxin-antitoxin system VapC family toxin [Streptosporangiaceae bacterium]